MTRIARAFLALLFAGFPGAAVAAGADLSNSAFGATPYTLSPTCDLAKLVVVNVTLRNSGDAATDTIPLRALDVTKELSGEMSVSPIAPGASRDVQLPMRAAAPPSAGTHVITVFFAPLRAMKALPVQVPPNLCAKPVTPVLGTSEGTTARSAGNVVADPASARRQRLRAALNFHGRPITQHFTVPSLIAPGPSEWVMARTSTEIATIKNQIDYQRKCDAADASTPARIDRVRGPVSPGIVVQITGECFGSHGGKVELVGLPSGPARLAVQSWDKAAISAIVPGLRGVGRQTVVLTVTPNYPAREDFNNRPRPGTEDVNANPRAGATPSPSHRTTPLAENIAARAAVRPGITPRPNEASVEFWPEVERRTVPEAVILRTCAPPAGCLSGGQSVYYEGFGYARGPEGAHSDNSRGHSGFRADGIEWLHSGEDVWLIKHPAGWYIESVAVTPGDDATLSAAPLREIDALSAVLTISWQDAAQGVGGFETGKTYFEAAYRISVTFVGPKGTWP